MWCPSHFPHGLPFSYYLLVSRREGDDSTNPISAKVNISVEVQTVARMWNLDIHDKLVGGYAADVFSCTVCDGKRFVLKAGKRHTITAEESLSEAAALRLWSGREAVKLVAVDEASAILLLERVEPGTALPRDESGRAGCRSSAGATPSSPHPLE